MGIVDSLSSEYGWTKDYILDHITLSEWLGLSDHITDRKKREYLLQLAIIQNPHTEKPNVLFEEIQKIGVQEAPEIDREGLKKLKEKLSKSNMIKVKK